MSALCRKEISILDGDIANRVIFHTKNEIYYIITSGENVAAKSFKTNVPLRPSSSSKKFGRSF